VLSVRKDAGMQTEPQVSLGCFVTAYIFTGYTSKHCEYENFLRDILIDFISKIQRSIADRAVGTRDCFVTTVCCRLSLTSGVIIANCNSVGQTKRTV